MKRTATVAVVVTALALTAGPAAAATSPWVLVPISDQTGSAAALQGAVSFGAAGAWSVGSRLDQRGFRRTWTQHWDGVSWQTVGSADTKLMYDRLVAVGGAAADDVWSVGYSAASVDDPEQASLMVQRIQGVGGSWSVVPVAAPGVASSLAAIDMVGAKDGWAVGSYRPSILTGSHGLILHWNGLSWQQVTAPDLGQPYHLTGVSGAGAGGVWAVGYTGQLGGDEHSVVLRWDGQSWQNVVGIDPQPGNAALFAVSAPAGGQAWAVGYSRVAGGADQAYVLHWAGTAWQPVPAVTGLDTTQLRAVVALPTGVWAAGYELNNGIDDQLMLSYNGSAFRLDELPTPISTGNMGGTALQALAGSPATGELWASGWLSSCPTCSDNEPYVLFRRP